MDDNAVELQQNSAHFLRSHVMGPTGLFIYLTFISFYLLLLQTSFVQYAYL